MLDGNAESKNYRWDSTQHRHRLTYLRYDPPHLTGWQSWISTLPKLNCIICQAGKCEPSRIFGLAPTQSIHIYLLISVRRKSPATAEWTGNLVSRSRSKSRDGEGRLGHPRIALFGNLQHQDDILNRKLNPRWVVHACHYDNYLQRGARHPSSNVPMYLDPKCIRIIGTRANVIQ